MSEPKRIIRITCKFGELQFREENLGSAREAEYRFRHEPFERRFAAMIISLVHGQVPDKLSVDIIQTGKSDDEEEDE